MIAQARRCAREGTILGSISRAQHRRCFSGLGVRPRKATRAVNAGPLWLERSTRYEPTVSGEARASPPR